MTVPPTSRVRWFLVVWLFVLSAVAFIDRVNLSIASTKISEEFAISNVRLGLVFSVFLFGYAIFQTPAGRLADRFGPRRMLTLGLVLWGVFSALTAAIPHNAANALLILVVIRFLLGVGEAVMFPASNQFVARWIPSNERGAANGIIFAGVGLGSAATPALITFIMLRYGWRTSFLLSALIGFAAGAVWFLAARDTPEEHPSVSRSELALIQQGIPESAASRDANLLSWSDILASLNVWILSLAYFCFGYVAWIFFSWIYLYLARVRGMDLKASALYATLPFLAMAVCSPLGGAISDALTKRLGARFGRCSVAALGFALTAIFVVFGSAAQDTRVASFVLAGGAGSLYLSQSSFWAVSADLGGKSSGSLSGFMNMANQIGGMITVSFTPFLAERFGWNTGFHVAAAVAALGAIAWLLVNPGATLSPSPANRSFEQKTA
ncbi:MAG: MFS transporter [Acidobacteria bacterium Pan2503]|uniref:MFS transporter n=1 Tax=Candidatus Acidiferrum panamense TaxID=2741543 RepID=A0A7V8NS05_9BACT|nr:MFS transporter [Candidatus Acidoferrum panamensis]